MSVERPAPLDTFTMRALPEPAQQRQAGLRHAPGAEHVGLERLAHDVEVGARRRVSPGVVVDRRVVDEHVEPVVVPLEREAESPRSRGRLRRAAAPPRRAPRRAAAQPPQPPLARVARARIASKPSPASWRTTSSPMPRLPAGHDARRVIPLVTRPTLLTVRKPEPAAAAAASLRAMSSRKAFCHRGRGSAGSGRRRSRRVGRHLGRRRAPRRCPELSVGDRARAEAGGHHRHRSDRDRGAGHAHRAGRGPRSNAAEPAPAPAAGRHAQDHFPRERAEDRTTRPSATSRSLPRASSRAPGTRPRQRRHQASPRS